MKILSVLFLLFVLLWLAPRADAQSPIVVDAQSVDIRFPRVMRFHLQVTSDAPIQLLRLTVWQRGTALGSRFTPQFSPARQVRTVYDWNFQSSGDGGYLPPGTHGEYTWHIEDANGNAYDTPRASYVVQDPGQNWQTLSNPDMRVSWHAGGGDFGAAVFARALAARGYLAQKLGIENIQPLEIFIYADRQDFFDALPPFAAEWTGGRMFPEYGVIMINFPPQNLEWGLRATSHELSHAILHSKIRGTLGELSIPHWLDEGLAVYNETTDHAPDDQFEASFQIAARRNTLIPLRKLEQRFPTDSDQANLAYAEGYNAVKFMIQEYGEEKFAALLDIYEKGALPDDGLMQAYGMNQDELENAWRTKLKLPMRQVSTSQLPTVAPQPTFEVSSPLVSPTTVATVTQKPTVEPTRVAEINSPVADTSVPAQQPALPTSGLCGGTILLSGIVLWGAWRQRRRL